MSTEKSVVLKVLKWVGIVIAAIAGAALIALLLGYFVMLLWNWLMPTIFGIKTIDFWQAFGLMFLARMIFGSLGGGGSHGSDKSHKSKKHGMPGKEDWGDEDDWGDKLEARLENWCSEKEKESNKGKYYHDFWKDEGKDSFERYIERKQAQEGPNPGDKTE